MVADKIIEESRRKTTGKHLLDLHDAAWQKEMDETHRGLKIAGAALLLPYLFKEEPNVLYVIDKDPTAPTPVITIQGNPFHFDTEIGLRMDGQHLLAEEPEDLTQGFRLLFFLVFCVQY